MSESFNLQNFTIFLLKNYGPFKTTPEELANGMNEHDTEYSISMTPQPDGTLLISVEEFKEEHLDESL